MHLEADCPRSTFSDPPDLGKPTEKKCAVKRRFPAIFTAFEQEVVQQPFPDRALVLRLPARPALGASGVEPAASGQRPAS